MNQINEKNSLNLLIFEIIERISRFSTHLLDIKNQFYNDGDSIVHDKLTFIENYEECLLKYFEITVSYQKLIQIDCALNFNKYLSKIELVLRSINDLHLNYLVHLPRPNEPVELRRFSRVIRKQIFNIEEDIDNSKNPISIYISEQIGENVYASDPLQEYKSDQINTLVFDYNLTADGKNIINDFIKKENSSEKPSFHITISRIDSINPCHWPTLLHEVSHTLMKPKFFKNDNIRDDFNAYIKELDATKYLTDLTNEKIDIKAWLTECWCDLFACASIGPSFYFSQYHSFLNYLYLQDNSKYPPALFRLNLIEKILRHRFRKNLKDGDFESRIESINYLISAFEKNNRHENSKLSKLFMLFKEYFLDHLFKHDGNQGIILADTEINARFQKTVRYVNDIIPNTIDKLVSNLEKGLPIPSYVESKDSTYYERPTSVQEILFAAWNYRNTSFKDKILAATSGFEVGMCFDELFENFKQKVSKEFNRFDQSLLRSIQVSEWFDALKDDDKVSNVNKLSAGKINNREKERLLVDWEIFDFIKSEDIIIIPIINLSEQLGSTSFDIRLGTTFELYLPNQFGILDFAEKESINKIGKSSHKVNLDYLDGIPINPGQFILGHSMEYIKLADNISADLEGRSSFARLGIEIHMTAGFIDPGFEGVLTFEIYNAGPSPVKLYPGMRVGQLRFMKINSPVKSYANKHTAKYAGLLEYNSSKQNQDSEVLKIAKLKQKKA